jgi:hypothetical protein
MAGLVWAQCLNEEELTQQLITERDKPIGEVAVPGGDVVLSPVQRVPRDQFGVVSEPPLDGNALDALVYPDANADERAAVLEGLTFFTTAQTAATGRGGVSNQANCLGCHTSSAEALPGLVRSISPASRAARSSPTNFAMTGQGRAADNDDAINDTGKTASFTIFGDICAAAPGPCISPRPGMTPPTANVAFGAFDGLARAPFFGPVQHTRPSLDSCPADPLPSFDSDPNLAGLDPVDGWMSNWLSPAGFRRSTVERAAPPYIGRGLMEAIPNADILALEDPNDTQGAPVPGCPGDCISGRANMATTNQTIGNSFGDSTPRLGRFGLRAQGPQLVAFPSVGGQEEVGTTSAVRPAENDNATATGRPECYDGVADPDICLSTIFSLRSLVRMTAPPEFGVSLLALLQRSDPTAQLPPGSRAGKVQRGAILFGVDLAGFANRMIPGRMPAGGDGRNPHAISQDNSSLRCASCHTPVQRTGTSPADVGARHLSNKWAPIFSDLLLHNMPVIDAERFAPTARLPRSVNRDGIDTFDLSRNFGEDALPNQGRALGDEFRTAPLMGLGRIGPPFLHDSRVYLSVNTVDNAPASTVTTRAKSDNLPLVVRTLDDAIRAAIELHDLPAPLPGCPVPPAGPDGLVRVGDVVYGSVAAATAAICPPLDSPKRGEARDVMRKFRQLTPPDQQALIEFLKEL